jgi:methyl-accepting chemotaxis protein
MNENHDFLAQSDVPFSSLQAAPPPGVNKEEQLWQEAVQRHPKSSFLKFFPYDATLLLGLIGALGYLFYKLSNLDPTSDQSFVDVINVGFPIALSISAFFMAVGLIQRLLLQRNEMKVEAEYQQLLNEYMKEHNPLTHGLAVDSYQKRLIDVLRDEFDDLKQSLDTNFKGLTDTMNRFVREMADYSGKEIESTLNKFSVNIQDLPEKLSQALERELEKPQQDQVYFREAVSGLLSLPPDFENLNNKLTANSDLLGASTRGVSKTIEHVAKLADKFNETSGGLSTTTKKLDAAVEKLNDLLPNLEKATGFLQDSQKDTFIKMQQLLNEMNSNVGQAIEKSADINNDAATKFSNSIESIPMHLDKSAHQMISENRKQSQSISEAILDSLDKLKAEAQALKETQNQFGRMIERAVKSSAKDANEVSGKISELVNVLNSYFSGLPEQDRSEKHPQTDLSRGASKEHGLGDPQVHDESSPTGVGPVSVPSQNQEQMASKPSSRRSRWFGRKA